MRYAYYAEEKTGLVHLDSRADIVDAVPTWTMTESAAARYHEFVRKSARSIGDWEGCTLDTARARFEQGDPAGASTARALADRLDVALESVAPQNTRRRPRWNEEDGDEFDRDRMLAGAPYWREMHRAARADTRGVRLLVQVGGSANRESSALDWNAAVGVALADILERAGMPVSIAGVFRSTHTTRNETSIFLAHAKACEQTLEPDRVYSTLSAPTFRHFLIRYLFAAVKQPTQAAGYPEDVRKLAPAMLDRLADDQHVIVLPQVYSESDALRAATDALTTYSLARSA